MDPNQIQRGGQVAGSAADEALFSKIIWRLLPLLIICYIIAFLDRINIGFAQLQMKQTLPFSNEAYAFGAGVFFIGYFLFEVPSNLMLEKIGARKTLLRIMVCWGLCASALMFVQTTTQFYIIRFLLGAFEAGFFPGIILYLTYWFPGARRGKVIAIFMTATALTQVIAGPVSGAILKYMNGVLGHHGWQWLFVMQGLPAVALGVIAFLYLQDRPEQAKWLSDDEKRSLRHHFDNDQQAVESASHGSIWELLRDPKVYTLAFVFGLFLGAVYTMIFWIPTLIKGWGVADVFTVGVLSSIPPLFGVVGCVLIGRSSDRHLERRWHFVFALAMASVGLMLTIIFQGNLVGSLIGLCIMYFGQAAATPLFFTGVSEYIPKKTAAGGIALISSLGNLGPSVMPVITSWVKTTTGTQVASLYFVMALYLAAATILAIVLRPAGRAQPAMA
ncbi:MAG: MFS transporter [Xanthobacteraceae bacterium]|nr:MFS transporter [Xanthobacteraceae bacterium]